MASSGDERGRLGVARRPENRDRPPRRRRHSDGRLREASAPLLRRAAQEDGRWVYDRWGPRVRKFLNLNPNFWIVTACLSSPPRRARPGRPAPSLTSSHARALAYCSSRPAPVAVPAVDHHRPIARLASIRPGPLARAAPGRWPRGRWASGHLPRRLGAPEPFATSRRAAWVP